MLEKSRGKAQLVDLISLQLNYTTAEQHCYCRVSLTSTQEQGSGVEVGKPRGEKTLDPSDTGDNKAGKAGKG